MEGLGGGGSSATAKAQASKRWWWACISMNVGDVVRRVLGQLVLPPECLSVEGFPVRAWFGKGTSLHLVEMVRAS